MVETLFLLAGLWLVSLALAWRWGKASAQPQVHELTDEVTRLQGQVTEQQKSITADGELLKFLRAERIRQETIHQDQLQTAQREIQSWTAHYQTARRRVMELQLEIEKLNGQLKGARARAKRKELARQSQTDELS